MAGEGFHRERSGWQPTAAQRRVLDALTQRLTNAEIAVRLGVSPETVKWHVSELLGETGLKDRHALARWWQRETHKAERRHVFAPLLSLLAHRASLLVLPAVVAVAIGLALLLRSGGNDKTPPPQSAAAPSVIERRRAASGREPNAGAIPT